MEGARPPAPPPPPALAAAGRRAPCARSAGSSRGITGARAAPASPAASPACRPTSAAPPAPASAPAPSPSRSPSSTATSSSPITTCWRRRARSGSRPTGCSTASAAASRDAMAPSCRRGSPSSARPRSAGASDSPSKPEFSMDHVACFYRDKCEAYIPAGVGGSIRSGGIGRRGREDRAVVG
ncbi:mucin-1-like [Triticum aestivum]|uniref:mucin-1-like n=1 Tax=Triticum aestivum TaxID=4565 RepID=UPI001D0319F7|nr:mucin-1-like [Triticum aestivum]